MPAGGGVSAAAPRRRWPDRTGGCGIRDRAERGGARFERGLAAHDLVELLVELFLIEQLAAGGAVDLGAQLRDAVFIGVLHLGLTGDQPGQDVVAKREIGGGRRRPHAEQHDRADNDPEHDGAEPDLLAGMHDGVAVAVDRCRLRRSWRDGGAASGHDREGGGGRNNDDRNGTTSALPRRSEMSSVRLNLRADLTLSWLIFGKWRMPDHMARTAASTSSAWPSTRTLRQIFAIRPSAPIRTVVRMIPMKLLPYIDFSPQAP